MTHLILPEQTYLAEALNYYPDTGLFTWRERPTSHFHGVSEIKAKSWNARYANTEAGSAKASGYINIKINGIEYRAARLAWRYMTGEDPEELFIDHIDRVRSNNAFANLRKTTHQQNHRNRTKASNNSSGVTGVHWQKGKNRWVAQIHDDSGIKISLGHFKDFQAACEVRWMEEINRGYASGQGV